MGRKSLGRRALGALALALLVLVVLPPFRWPVRGPVSSPFFWRRAPGSGLALDFELHRGLDIAAPLGSPVRATAPGLVIEAGRDAELGNYVRMRHLFGIESVYGHLSRLDARPGRLVLLPGLRALGAVGSTGRSTGPHLHFGLRSDGAALPPGPLLVFHSIRRAIIGI